MGNEMQTMDVFVVTRWERYEGEELLGIYRRQSDAEYIRDHAEAIAVKDFVESFPQGKRDDAINCCNWLDEIVGFAINEEEVYL